MPKVRRRASFSIVENAVIDDPRLSGSDKLMYMALARFANADTGKAYPSITTLCKKASMSRPTAIKALRQLEECGHIEAERRTGKISTYWIGTSKASLPDQLKSDTGTSKKETHEQDSLNKIHLTRPMSGKPDRVPVAEVLDYLNEAAGRAYQASTERYVKLITTIWRRLPKIGVTDQLGAFKEVIDVKCGQWLNKPEMVHNLRPQTLFLSFDRFETYLNESPDYVRWQNGKRDQRAHGSLPSEPADDERSVGQGDRVGSHSGSAG